jgi:hypothetical protein
MRCLSFWWAVSPYKESREYYLLRYFKSAFKEQQQTHKKISEKLSGAQYGQMTDTKQKLFVPGIKYVCEFNKVILNARINIHSHS